MTMGVVDYDPATEARRVLDQVWISKGMPVDPARVAWALGLKVMISTMDAEVSGMLVKKQGHDPLIRVNRSDSPNRRRFACAHEIGHYVGRSSDLDRFEYIDRRDAMSSATTDPDEVAANMFAAALLVPLAELRRLHERGFDEIELAWKFGVPREVMHTRLLAVGLDYPG